MDKENSIQITCDGTARSCHVFDESGREIDRVCGVDVSIRADMLAKATLHYDFVGLKIKADKVEHVYHVLPRMLNQLFYCEGKKYRLIETDLV